jgi:hypothetical protein
VLVGPAGVVDHLQKNASVAECGAAPRSRLEPSRQHLPGSAVAPVKGNADRRQINGNRDK